MYKMNFSWIDDGEDKKPIPHNTDEERLKELIDMLTKRAKKLRNELEAINEEIYKLECSLLGRN